MVTLEQIKLLESKISRAINFVVEVTEENGRLKKRNDELERTVEKLREEKNRVEEGIISALGKLNQFEDAIERSLSAVKINPKSSKPEKNPAASAEAAATPPQTTAPPQTPAPAGSGSAEAPQAPQIQQTAEAAPVVPPQPPQSEKEPEQASKLPSAYTIDEAGDEVEEIEDSGEAELDIF